ncbi:MAG TPA: TRAP transporter small permease [Burkholderiaceae bacterium]|nr:TRAP transporter small permease [Burkholderiaceae bacterium]
MQRMLRGAAALFALAGGALLVLIAAVTAASVIGRWLYTAPMSGDIELVQLGTASALALFLPYCQLHGSHLVVDVFTARAPKALHRRLDRLVRGLAALTLALLALRAGVGLADLRAAGETSMVLGLPLWLAYGALPPSLGLAALIAIFGSAPQPQDMRG